MTEKKTTVRDLKTFIEAVEFAADTDGWVPSPRQWAKIRSMIELLDDGAQQQVPRQPDSYAIQQPVVQYQQPQYQQPAAPAIPVGPSGLGMRPGPQMPPMGGMPLLMNQGGAVKAPDIDTSNGQYSSMFA